MKIPIRCQIIVNLAVALCLTTQSWADRSGPYWSDPFQYFVDGDSIEIASYSTADAVATVEIPAEIAGLPVTSIGDWAFSHEELISITIPEGVTFIGAQAFFDCSSLTSVTIPEGVTSIGSETFSRCSSLTNVIIPEGVTTIGCAAFSFCTSLTSVSIPATTTSIQGYLGGTYYDCESFFGCSSLNEFVVAPGNPVYSSRDGVLFSADGTILLRCPRGKSGGYSIPSGVTTIAGDYYTECLDFGLGSVCFPTRGRGAFSGCARLTDVTIPASVSHIGISAFSGCSALTRISIADGIARIDEQAFSQCTGLTSFTIPPSVTSIGSRAFSECTGLTSIVISEGVTSIAEFAFLGCSGLTSVTIPASVTSIEGVLFRECSSLVTIDVEPDNPVYVSGDGVLIDAMNGILLECPDAKMDSYDVPKNITSIGESAFSACSKLTTITIPEGVTAVGSWAFWGCSRLLGLVVPGSVSTIGESAFQGCSSLRAAVFLGDVPPDISIHAFDRTAPDFTIYYLSGSAGFTSPNWNGYPTVRIGRSTHPAAIWLLEHGLPYETDLQQDHNGDGVSPLMAYALDLDPNSDLGSQLPIPVLGENELSMSFHAATPGISYTVETSTDLRSWTTTGVTLSELDAENQRAASVRLDSPRRFLRLVVSETP